MGRTREQERVYQLRRYHARRAEGVRILGGKCVQCGTQEDLHFDHRNPKDKSFDISKLKGSYADFLRELSKCQLLCGTHHREKHRSKAQCGTVQRYWRGCRCERCKAASRRHRNGGIDKPPKAIVGHGTRSKYIMGCRCDQCREQQRLYMQRFRSGA